MWSPHQQRSTRPPCWRRGARGTARLAASAKSSPEASGQWSCPGAVLCVLLHSLSVLLLFLLYYFLKWYSDNNTPKTPCTLACPGQCQSPLLGTGCPHTGPPLWNWTCGSAIIQLKHPFTKWLWLWFQAQMAKQDCSWQLALQCIRNSNNPSPGCVHCLPPHFISLVSYLLYKSWVATKFRSAYTISFFASISL